MVGTEHIRDRRILVPALEAIVLSKEDTNLRMVLTQQRPEPLETILHPEVITARLHLAELVVAKLY